MQYWVSVQLGPWVIQLWALATSHDTHDQDCRRGMSSIAKLHVLDAVKDLSHYWSCGTTHAVAFNTVRVCLNFPHACHRHKSVQLAATPKVLRAKWTRGCATSFRSMSIIMASDNVKEVWSKSLPVMEFLCQENEINEITICCLDVVAHLSRQCLMRWQSASLWSCLASQRFDPGPWPCNCFRGAKQDLSASFCNVRCYTFVLVMHTRRTCHPFFYAVRLVWRPVSM